MDFNNIDPRNGERETIQVEDLGNGFGEVYSIRRSLVALAGGIALGLFAVIDTAADISFIMNNYPQTFETGEKILAAGAAVLATGICAVIVDAASQYIQNRLSIYMSKI